jgi:hypothetical protein
MVKSSRFRVLLVAFTRFSLRIHGELHKPPSPPRRHCNAPACASAEEVDFREGSSGSDVESSDPSSEPASSQEQGGDEAESSDVTAEEAPHNDGGGVLDGEDSTDDDLDDSGGGGKPNEQRNTSSCDEDDDDDDKRGVEELEAPQQVAKGFLEGGKDATFARAVSRILLQSSSDKGTAVLDAPILAGSKSVARRKAEEEAEAKADRAAKRLRREMRQRGHVVPTRKGENPASDAKEKALQRIATRGVVQLFNAVAKAQRQLREAEDATGNRAKAAKLGKASFLAELKNARSKAAAGGIALPSDHDKSARNVASELRERGSRGGEGADEPGWAVLQEGFTGLQGGSKMKDWDREQEREGEGGELEHENDGASSEGYASDDGGW